MAAVAKTCVALFPKIELKKSTTSLAEFLEHGPSGLRRWKTSTMHEGAHMGLANVVSHYPTIKWDKVHEGVSPDEPDVKVLSQKVESVAWKLASYCPLDEHVEDLPAIEEE